MCCTNTGPVAPGRQNVHWSGGVQWHEARGHSTRLNFILNDSIFEITILGCGALNPTLRHMTSCQVVNYQDKLYMIDCGEAAQWSLQKYGINIFSTSSHFH